MHFPCLATSIRKALPALAMGWCLGTGEATAASIAMDDFESYAVGGLNGNNGGSGWGGAWSATSQVSVVSGGLSYSNGSVSINGGSRAARFVPNEGTNITDGIVSRALASGQSGTVYMSFLFSDTVNPDLSGSNDFIQFGFDTGGGNPRSSIMRRNGTFQSRTTTATGGSADSGISSVVGNTYLLVFKAEKTGSNYDAISLFVNPSSSLEPVADAVASGDSGLASLSALVGRSAFHEIGDTFLIDQLTIGTSFADVVPVPEPSSWFIVSLGSVILLRRRR